MASNLPPGVTEGMIPGNRPEDAAWDSTYEAIDNDAAENRMSDMDVFAAWRMGLQAYLAARALKVKFLHDGPEPDFCDPNPES